MMWPQLQTVAQVAIGRILNSLPEGLVIALFAGAMLRCLPRQNSGTRFAVWFLALLSVAGLPWIGGIEHSLVPSAALHPLLTLPGDLGLLLFVVWVVMASVSLLHLAVGLRRLHALRQNCVAIEVAGLDPAIRKTIASLSSPRSVTLATSEQVSVPAAIGFFNPMIVIPSWALRELPPQELNVIVLHELAHLRRWDDWTNLLQKIVRAIFLFHPAVWWIESRLSLEREMACDDHVLAETANPRAYAECLILLLEKSGARRGWAMAQALVHRAREASLRLAQILDASRPATKYISKPALGLVGAFSVVCLLAVPRAQLVAVDQGHSAPAIEASMVRVAPSSQSQFPAVAVTPASVRTGTSSSPRKVAQHPAPPLIAKLPVHRPSAPQAIEARWSTDKQRGQAETLTTVGSNQGALPESQALLIVRTVQQVGPNSWVWSVGVWRVTVVNTVQQQAERVAVASKT